LSAGRVETRLQAAGIELPRPSKAIGIYAPACHSGNLLFVAGHGPLKPDRTLICGRVGDDIDVATAAQAARVTAINTLATLKKYLGSLDHVVRPLKVLGLVRALPDFTEQPKVIDGYSDVLRIAFGDENLPARSAIGVASLPGGICVEVEAIFEIDPNFRGTSGK
jgi:enamine deaminase RidA (YjgF/YER057c/UK114 family)